MLSTFFSENEVPVKKGDFAAMKPQYIDKFPSVPANRILKIEKIEQEEASVVFAHYSGTKICKETLPLYTLYTVN